MPFENWIAFAAASIVMLAIPGPTILLVISYALGHGRKAGTATVAGVALGDFTAMNEVYAKYFSENKPARATVQAAGLPRGARVEIDCIAIV